MREAVITKDAVDSLKRAFERIPKMYEKFYSQLENEKIEDAKEQIDFVIDTLESVIRGIDGYKSILSSHKNDATIAAEDFASLQRLDILAQEQKKELVFERNLYSKYSK